MKRIAFRYGPLMFAGFLLYFLIMKALNLSEQYNFRLFNGVIQIVLIFLAIRKYKEEFPGDFNVLSGTVMGIVTSLVGIIPFAIFQLIYLNLDTQFMQYLQENVSMVGEYLTPFTAALILFMEGFAVSFVASYILVRILFAANPDPGVPGT